MTRAPWIVALPLALGACAPLTLATLALDGVSYATTGKSVSDHTLSAMAGRDCSLLRLMKGGPVCRAPAPGPDVTMTALAAVPRQAAGPNVTMTTLAAVPREAAGPGGSYGAAPGAIELAAGPGGSYGTAPGAMAPLAYPPLLPRAAAGPPPAPPGGRAGAAGAAIELAAGSPLAPPRGLAPAPAAPFLQEGFYLVRADGPQLVLRIDRLAASAARLEGFGAGIELYALVQDDGALEVFVHDPAGAAANLRLVLRLDGWTREPAAFTGIWLNGALHLLQTIIV